MKYLHKAFIIPVLMLALAGCNDFLNRSPYDQITQDVAFRDADMAESVVTGVYNSFYIHYISDDDVNWDALSSIMQEKIGDTSLLTFMSGTIQANSSLFGLTWRQFYEIINRANDVINNIGSCPEMSDELKSRRIAECKFLRAYGYYRLNCLWRGVPVYLENLPPDEYTRPRSTEGEVWNVILDDLNDCIACEDLPGKYSSSDGDYGRITKGACYTLRGKVYLWLKEWAEAQADFEEVGELGYKLFEGSYADLFKIANERCDEMILSAPMEDLGGHGNVYSSDYGNACTTGTGQPIYFMNPRFIDSYEKKDGSPFDWDEVIEGYNKMEPKARSVYFLRNNMTEKEKATMTSYGADIEQYLETGNEERIKKAFEGRDPRLEATVITPYSTYVGGRSGSDITYTFRWPFRDRTSVFDIETHSNAYCCYLIRKFVTVGREFLHATYNPVDVPVFRYADVLLCLAEALNEQGQYEEAMKYVNMVRKRAGVAELNGTDYKGDPVNSADALRPRIRNEKKWELACEEQLYFEELRWGTWKEDKFFEGSGQQECWGHPVFQYYWGGDKYLKWPIPSGLIEKEHLQQNEGWY